MKKIITPGLITVIFATRIFTACNKPDPEPVTHNLAANTAPIAHAGKDTTIIFPVTSVLLDGNASTDKENNIVSYSWRDLSWPLYSDIIEKKNSAKTLAECYENRSYQFELTVTDKGGLSSKDTLVVSEVLPTPKPGDIKAGDDITLTLPTNRTVLETISKIAYPYYAGIVKNWKKISGPNSIPNPNSAAPLLTDLVEGVYQFELTVTYWDQFTDKDTMTVTVLPDNNVYTTEKIFENIHSTCDNSSCSIKLNGISSIVPTTQPFKLYLKADINTDWQLVIDAGHNFNHAYSFDYVIRDNSMEIETYRDSGDVGGGSWDEIKNSVENINTTIKVVY